MAASRLVDALRNPAVWVLAASIFFANTGGYAMVFWMRTTIEGTLKEGGYEVTEGAVLGLMCVIYAVGVVGVGLAGWSSDRHKERKWHCAVGMAGTGTALAASTLPGQPLAAVFAWLCLMGFFAFWWPPPFWVLPTLTMSASAAAASIGYINICANVAGFVGPLGLGQMHQSGVPDWVLLVVAASCYIAGGGVVTLLRVPRARPLVASAGTIS